ncbi:MAG TPA: putative Ig domain-containing protein, partial [Sphingomicrobium sp.]|nr:putative Ig domain-containing protein [Sphingomicrobium sp.]
MNFTASSGGVTVNGSGQATFVDPVEVFPETLPDAFNGSAYSETLGATGGSGSYSYAVSSGSLPAGLSLATSGLLSGTPSAV